MASAKSFPGGTKSQKIPGSSRASTSYKLYRVLIENGFARAKAYLILWGKKKNNFAEIKTLFPLIFYYFLIYHRKIVATKKPTEIKSMAFESFL